MLDEILTNSFLLYYATWLVHAPIHTRSKERLGKYAKRLGIDPANTPTQETPGQLNPYYRAMVEELDYYAGKVFDYLEQTEDPRWPDHKLSENTYLIFTSDNGGMEGGPKERCTDNNPGTAAPLPHKDEVCVVLSHQRDESKVQFTYEAKVVHADLIYTPNGGERYEEWYRTPAELTGENLQQRFKSFDRNGDGQVSRDEFVNRRSR